MDFADRVQYIIESVAGGNASEFVRLCEAVDPASAPSHSGLMKYLKHGSVPRMDALVTMARAGGVTIAWLATGHEERKKPAPQLGAGLVDFDKGEVRAPGRRPAPSRSSGPLTGYDGRLVDPGEVPASDAHIRLGWVIRSGDRDMLTIDFLVRGRGERLAISADVDAEKKEG